MSQPLPGHPLRASDRLSAARSFAAVAHTGQGRKGTRFPYMVHPLEVARIVARYYPGQEDLIIAALLHDTLEDTAATAPEIAILFGAPVAALVLGVTAARGTSWRDTRTITLAKLASASPDVVRLKAADGLSNVRSLRRDIAKAGAAATYRKFKSSGPADMAWYHSGICEIATRRLGDEPLVVEYRAVIKQLWPKV